MNVCSFASIAESHTVCTLPQTVAFLQILLCTMRGKLSRKTSTFAHTYTRQKQRIQQHFFSLSLSLSHTHTLSLLPLSHHMSSSSSPMSSSKSSNSSAPQARKVEREREVGTQHTHNTHTHTDHTRACEQGHHLSLSTPPPPPAPLVRPTFLDAQRFSHGLLGTGGLVIHFLLPLLGGVVLVWCCDSHALPALIMLTASSTGNTAGGTWCCWELQLRCALVHLTSTAWAAAAAVDSITAHCRIDCACAKGHLRGVWEEEGDEVAGGNVEVVLAGRRAEHRHLAQHKHCTLHQVF